MALARKQWQQQESVECLLIRSSRLRIKVRIGYCTAKICSKRSNVWSRGPSSGRAYVRHKLNVVGHFV